LKKAIVLWAVLFLYISCGITNQDYFEVTIRIMSDDNEAGSTLIVNPGMDKTVEIFISSEYRELDDLIIYQDNTSVFYSRLDSKSAVQNFDFPPPPVNSTCEYKIVVRCSGREYIKKINLTSNPLIDKPLLVESDYEELVIPEIAINTGGIQANPAPVGNVYYFNSAHLKAESDIQLDEPAYYDFTVKRYFRVSGIAIPDDAGFTDRWYHSCQFTAYLLDENNNFTERFDYTFMVDDKNQFNGYIYLPRTGRYYVYAYRKFNFDLYPRDRGITSSVVEGCSTLVFKVNNSEEISSSLQKYLPTYNTDAANPLVREYARYLTQYCTSDFERAQVIYHFLVFGDENGAFQYMYNQEQYPTIATQCSDLHIGSNFLVDRVGVCNDFAETYAAMLRSLGIDVKKQSGYTEESGHQWNLVTLNDKIYHVDATWGNGVKSHYKEYAEFYSEFDLVTFITEHDNRYCNNSVITY